MLLMVPELYVAAEAWKTMKKETPALLRAWLLKHWVDLMLKGVEMIMTSEETIQQAKDMLLLDDQCNVPYLEWNRNTRALQIKRDRDPITLTQVLELLKAMQTLVIQPVTVIRFHATRELCQDRSRRWCLYYTAGRLKDSRRAPTLKRATVLPAE